MNRFTGNPVTGVPMPPGQMLSGLPGGQGLNRGPAANLMTPNAPLNMATLQTSQGVNMNALGGRGAMNNNPLANGVAGTGPFPNININQLGALQRQVGTGGFNPNSMQGLPQMRTATPQSGRIVMDPARDYEFQRRVANGMGMSPAMQVGVTMGAGGAAAKLGGTSVEKGLSDRLSQMSVHGSTGMTLVSNPAPGPDHSRLLEPSLPQPPPGAQHNHGVIGNELASAGSGGGSSGGSGVAETAFDLNDFPALGPNSDSLSRMGSLSSTHKTQQEFTIQNEDFPALGVASSTKQADSVDGGNVAKEAKRKGSAASATGAGEGEAPVVSTASASATTTAQSQAAGGGNPDPFSLMGLLRVIRMTDADLNTLALGTDLTTLGLNLNSPECLYATFQSPWAESAARRESEYNLPLCYYMQPPALKTSHFQKFTLETLFYIFYNMPRDAMQAYAATELYHRGWRYHKEMKLWVSMKGSEVRQKCAQYERGSFLYFDVSTWERVRNDDLVIYPEHISHWTLPTHMVAGNQGVGGGSPAIGTGGEAAGATLGGATGSAVPPLVMDPHPQNPQTAIRSK